MSVEQKKSEKVGEGDKIRGWKEQEETERQTCMQTLFIISCFSIDNALHRITL